jgi:hypothetical protein
MLLLANLEGQVMRVAPNRFRSRHRVFQKSRSMSGLHAQMTTGAQRGDPLRTSSAESARFATQISQTPGSSQSVTTDFNVALARRASFDVEQFPDLRAVSRLTAALWGARRQIFKSEHAPQRVAVKRAIGIAFVKTRNIKTRYTFGNHGPGAGRTSPVPDENQIVRTGPTGHHDFGFRR